MILGSNSEKPDITYPCNWIYTIFVKDPLIVEETLERILTEFDYDFSPSKSSRGGKYYSFKVEVSVPSEMAKDSIFELLSNAKEILFVL